MLRKLMTLEKGNLMQLNVAKARQNITGTNSVELLSSVEL